MTELYVQDVTLRDGMHAIRHQYHARAGARASPRALDAAGVDAIEITHGDGLAGGRASTTASAAHTDWEWIEAAAAVAAARQAHHAAAARASAPSHDLKRRLRARASRSVRIATHCTEADIAAQHIATARELGMDVVGFLMMSHMTDARRAGAAGQADGVATARTASTSSTPAAR